MGNYINPRYHKERRLGHKKAVRDYLGGKCVSCGVADNLDIDHINREDKTFNFSISFGKSLKNLFAEADKCQLLCRSCHLNKTAKEMSKTGVRPSHGSYSYYSNQGCRCSECKTAWSAYMRSRKMVAA